MAQYQIPEQYLPGFKQLLSLELEQVKKIAATLSEMPVGSGPKTMISLLAKDNDLPFIQEIGQSIFSMGKLLTAKDANLSEISLGLAQAYVVQNNEALENDEVVKNLTEKIEQLLVSGKNLKTTFKAFSLLSSNERIYRKGQIISDIRLVFNDELEEHQRHALILHQLKIEHQIDYDSQDFFLTLDTKSLRKLKEQIDRALIKEETIKANYSNEMFFIEVTE